MRTELATAATNRRHRLGSGVQDRRLLAGPASRAVVPVVVAGAVVLGFAIGQFALDWSLNTAGGVLALLAAAVTAEAFPVPIEGVAAGRTSLATIFIVGAAVEYGWAAATIVGFGTMLAVELASRRGVDRIAYNASLYTLGGCAGG